MRIDRFVVASMFALVCCVAAQAAAPALPAPVAKALKENTDLCKEVGGKPDASKAIQRADLNGDGIEDYIFSVRGITCEGAYSIYGDREMLVAVYVADGKGGAKEAFSEATFGMELKGTGPSAKLWLTVMAEGCGKKPAKDFASENFCERSIVWNAKTQKFDWAPVSTVKMIQ
jgi:hypothetical protein